MNGYSTIITDPRVALLFQHGYQHQESFFFSETMRQTTASSSVGSIVEEAERKES